MSAPGRPAAKPLAEALRATIDAGLGHVRRIDPDAAYDLDELRRRDSGHPTVVVVGETKRGKSSLINALLGVPGLSPVDAAVATSAYLEFRYGERAGAVAHVPGVDPVPFPLADLRDWGTVLGSLPEGTRPPRRIEVHHPSPLLNALTLVDTPGVGGLDSAHAEIALDAVSNATALLFVVDASSPFSRPELDFLTEASKRVNLVIFALTKTDSYPGWRTILDDDKSLLHAHAPRFSTAQFIPVSARLAELAGQLPPEAATELLSESRITGLRSALTEQVAAKADLLVLTNLLRSVRSELVRLDMVTGDRMKSADPDPDLVRRLKEERTSVAGRKRSEARHWSITLSTETRRARTEATSRLRAQFTGLQDEYMKVLEKANAASLKRLPYDVDRSLNALSLRMSAELESRFRRIGVIVLREVFTEQELHHILRGLNARLRREVSQKMRRDGGGGDNALVIASSAGMAMMAGRGAMGLGGGALAGVAGAGIALPVIGVGVGLAAGAWLIWKRKVMTDRQQAKMWLREVLAEARAALQDEIAQRFTDVEYILTVSLDEAIERRIAQLDGQIEEIDRTMAEDKASRAKRKASLSTDRDGLRQRIRQLDDMLAKVRQATKPADESIGRVQVGAAQAGGSAAGGSAVLQPARGAKHAAEQAASPAAER